MLIDILSAVPNLMQSPLQHSILQRAQQKGILAVRLFDIRDYSEDKNRHIDDYAFGGSAGMVLKIEPLARAIRSLQVDEPYDEIIYLTPDGELFNQATANQLSLKKRLLLIAGHYKGIDQRVRDLFVTREISIGDYVLSGGELPALVLVDALGRLLPGVLNDETSALTDSFQDGLLAPPVYTRPADFEGHEVPAILRSGNFAHIRAWEDQTAWEKTQARRPDLIRGFEPGTAPE
jgi:tRNA (guanine37-N1)-methyltransferase